MTRWSISLNNYEGLSDDVGVSTFKDNAWVDAIYLERERREGQRQNVKSGQLSASVAFMKVHVAAGWISTCKSATIERRHGRSQSQL